MRWRTCLALLSIGLGILIVGFVYDLSLAGAPPQAATPAMQAGYLYHSRMARSIETVGMMLWALGVINVVLSYVHSRLAKRAPKEPGPGRSVGARGNNAA